MHRPASDYSKVGKMDAFGKSEIQSNALRLGFLSPNLFAKLLIFFFSPKKT